MSLKNSLKELKEYFAYRRREMTVRSKLLRKHLKKESERVEYYNFKKVIFQKIDELLYSGEFSKVVLKPLEGKEHLFPLLLEDEDFNRFYNGRLTVGGELEVSAKKIE